MCRSVNLSTEQQARVADIAKKFETQGEKLWLAGALAMITTLGLVLGLRIGYYGSSMDYMMRDVAFAIFAVGGATAGILTYLGSNRLSESWIESLKDRINDLTNPEGYVRLSPENKKNFVQRNVDQALDHIEKDLNLCDYIKRSLKQAF